MQDKCVYCGAELTDSRATSICNKCGVKVWGEKMFNTILQNMNEAKERDDLCSTNLDPEKIYS